MNIGFILRSSAKKLWAGDIAVVESMMQGLKQLGHESKMASSPLALQDCDHLVYANMITEEKNFFEEMEIVKKPFSVLSFYENLIQYHMPATGFCKYVMSCLGYGFPTDNGMDFDIELLFEMPHLGYYYGEPPRRSYVQNLPLAKNAAFWIASSPTEEKTILEDWPDCKTTVIPIAPGIVTSWDKDPDDSFLRFTGLSSGSYLLQVGRLEMRKNQLATILATRDLDLPLVFISTTSLDYENLCVEAAVKWRKAPTLFISQSLAPREEGPVRVLSMPKGKKLPIATLVSAYHHAGLHIHPSFHELPGATYLEAARFGTPSLASTWCTINDYFYDPALGHSQLDGRIVYTEPANLPVMRQKIEMLFGKKFPPLTNHPALSRTHKDVAEDFLKNLQK